MGKVDAKRFLTEAGVTVCVSVASLLLYTMTICPAVPFTDGGELAAVGATLGIAHPTGYPLFTLLARLATIVPLGFPVIFKLNLMAALFTAVAAGFCTSVILLLIRSRVFGKYSPAHSSDDAVAAGFGAIALACSSTFWSQSAEVEVYSLHLLLIMAIVYAFLRGIEESNQDSLSPFLIVAAFGVGLSFTNHMTTLLLAPALLYLFGKKFGVGRHAARIGLVLVPFFLLGLSLYLYLPVRSAANPMFDWGHPATLERFVWHVSGKQYQVWMFSGWATAKKQLAYYVSNLPHEFNWGLIGLMLVGMWDTVSRRRGLALFVLLAILAALTYSINYDIHDIDAYFLLSYVALAWLVGFGARRVLEFGRRHLHPAAVALLFISLLGWQVWQNFARVDQSDNLLVEDFVENSFSSLEPNAIVFTGLWDYLVSPSYYYQAIEKRRPDVIVVDKNLLQDRSWYFLQLRRNQPWFIEQSRAEVEGFLAELEKFEHGRPFDLGVIQHRWNALLESLVDRSIHIRPIYVDGRIEPEFPKKFKRVQSGLFFRLTLEDQPISPRSGAFRFRPHDRRTPAIEDLRQYYVLMLLNEAITLWRQGEASDAEKTINLAKRIDPSNRTLVALSREMGERGRQ